MHAIVFDMLDNAVSDILDKMDTLYIGSFVGPFGCNFGLFERHVSTQSSTKAAILYWQTRA